MRSGCLTVALAFALALPARVTAAPLPSYLPPVGALSAATGLASVAAADDPSIVYWNPAGLALMDQMTTQLTIASTHEGRPSSWSVLIANSLQGEGSRFGLGLIRRYSTNDAGEYRSFVVISPLSFAAGKRRLPVGLSLKFLSENFGERWVYGMGLDAGAALQSREGGMALAVSALNFAGANLRAFPSESWIGLRWGPNDPAISLAAQARLDRPFDGDYISRNYNAGVRWQATKSLPELRAGMIRSGVIVHYTAGLGYDRPSNNQLEYALVWNRDDAADRIHFLTYGYSLRGGPSSKRGNWERGN